MEHIECRCIQCRGRALGEEAATHYADLCDCDDPDCVGNPTSDPTATAMVMFVDITQRSMLEDALRICRHEQSSVSKASSEGRELMRWLEGWFSSCPEARDLRVEAEDELECAWVASSQQTHREQSATAAAVFARVLRASTSVPCADRALLAAALRHYVYGRMQPVFSRRPEWAARDSRLRQKVWSRQAEAAASLFRNCDVSEAVACLEEMGRLRTPWEKLDRIIACCRSLLRCDGDAGEMRPQRFVALLTFAVSRAARESDVVSNVEFAHAFLPADIRAGFRACLLHQALAAVRSLESA